MNKDIFTQEIMFVMKIPTKKRETAFRKKDRPSAERDKMTIQHCEYSYEYGKKITNESVFDIKQLITSCYIVRQTKPNQTKQNLSIWNYFKISYKDAPVGGLNVIIIKNSM